MTEQALQPRRAAVVILRLVVLVLLVILINRYLGGFFRELGYQLSPEDAAALRRGLIVTCLLYALLLAVPFVPGVEIGIGLLTMFGATVAIHVYVATVLGLSLAFLIGRLVPMHLLARGAATLRFRRMAALIAQLEPLSQHERIALLTAQAPNRWVPLLVRHRLLALALALNIPGNALIGGGGGIALATGLSRVVSVPAFLIVVVIAVAPVPILVMFLGPHML